MNSPTDRFIRTYEEIKTEVNLLAGDSSSTKFEIEKAKDRNSLVKKNLPLLKNVRDIRNLLQHPKHKSDGPAFQISKTFLDEIQELLDGLKNPPTVNSVGVPRKEIMTACLTDRLGSLADGMKQKGFTHIPILNKYGAVIAVFNEAAVFDYLWTETEMIVGRQMKISDIYTHCRLDADHTESFRFVSPRMKLDDIVEIFRAVESPITRVGAAFVTASGKNSEPLQRLITSWDVLDRFSAK